ncbi:aldehyde dehydrogenase [Ectobacillus polymachus]|uniref:aldehyde dehydrogenase n=1 Tax=Ectobacillus polymachus TaxID=1508806 RepID=UPI003A8AD1CC
MDISSLVQEQKNYFYSGQTRALPIRLLHLDALYKGIQKYEREIIDALQKDLHKSEFDSFTTEIGYVYKEISFVKKHLSYWMKPKKAKGTFLHFGSKGKMIAEPYGVTLILAPWNYPFQLAIAPLIGAIAAGNTAIIKPSELTPTVSAVIAKLIEDVFEPTYIAVVEGGIEESTELLQQPFDFIFFTGSVAVGKKIMEAAAKQLIPIVLELGGKSPCIVHYDANLKLAARRIVWGKFLNAGQTCVAPDYLYVHQAAKEELLSYIKEEIELIYGKQPLHNEQYTHIVSERHFQRLEGFLTNGNMVAGGETDKEQLAIAPTILDQISWEDAVMQDEIFGPILPVLTYEDLEEVITVIQSHPKPLALYAFSESKKFQDDIVERLSYGGGCINDTVYHLTNPFLPFGGVGESGIGGYHGEHSFYSFSHQKSVLYQTTKFDFKFRYYPSEKGLTFIKKLLK